MRKLLVCAMCMLMLLALGCAGESKRTANNNAKEKKVVHLAAAASLEKVFEQQLIPMFTKKHPHLKIQGIYDASGKLQSQIENGLSADIFISAATKQMQALDKKGYLDSASIKPLLENKLVLIVPAKGASDIKEFKDIAKSEEDVLSLALFPQVAPKFIANRDNPVAAPDAAPASKADPNAVRELYVEYKF